MFLIGLTLVLTIVLLVVQKRIWRAYDTTLREMESTEERISHPGARDPGWPDAF